VIAAGPVQGQSFVFGVLGLLAVFTAGGAAWSAATGPHVADAQVRVAAANTAAAPSFMMDLDATIVEEASGTSIGPNTVLKDNEKIVYQAPNRLMLTDSESQGAGSVTQVSHLTQIGADCWYSGPGGTAQAKLNCLTDFGPDLLKFPSGLEEASGVSHAGGEYVLSPSGSLDLLRTLFGRVQFVAGATSIKVQIKGSTISEEDLSFEVAIAENGISQGLQEKIEYDLRFADVGTAGPIVRPSEPPNAVA
jgi:hypothetical protein